MSSSVMGETNMPTEAMIKLMAPDGYYSYLGIQKSAKGEVDEDVIKKNYRKLSLRHHPDKGGDADTFRVLNRAQKVLKTPKLREQYDILGLDLDDDEEHTQDDDATDPNQPPTTSQGIVHEMASTTLTYVLQMGVRTIMMAAVSLVVVRYQWLLYPALAFLAFIAYKIHSSVQNSTLDLLSPFLLGTGLILMYKSSQEESLSGFRYWVGESMVIAMFTFNSISGTELPSTVPLQFVLVAIGIFSGIAALWFRGKFWNYAIVIGLEFFLAIFVAMAFPVMEMILEAVMNEKLKKVGEKVRAHHQHLERYYSNKANKE